MCDKKFIEVIYLDCVKGDLYCDRKDWYYVKVCIFCENIKYIKNFV